MLKQEFEKRVNFEVSEECYSILIEPEYNNSDLDKDAWCKQWKKNNGIQKAYNFEMMRSKSLSKTKMEATEAYLQSQKREKHLMEENFQLKTKIKEWKNNYNSMITRLKSLVDDFELYD